MILINQVSHGTWHTYISYEILKYRRKRNACNIYGGEILKYWRICIGHDVQQRKYGISDP